MQNRLHRISWSMLSNGPRDCPGALPRLLAGASTLAARVGAVPDRLGCPPRAGLKYGQPVCLSVSFTISLTFIDLLTLHAYVRSTDRTCGATVFQHIAPAHSENHDE